MVVIHVVAGGGEKNIRSTPIGRVDNTAVNSVAVNCRCVSATTGGQEEVLLLMM